MLGLRRALFDLLFLCFSFAPKRFLGVLLLLLSCLSHRKMGYKVAILSLVSLVVRICHGGTGKRQRREVGVVKGDRRAYELYLVFVRI
jgi:hypothetical protein